MADNRRQNVEEANRIIDELEKDNILLPILKYALMNGENRLREGAHNVRRLYMEARRGNLDSAEVLRDTLIEMRDEMNDNVLADIIEADERTLRFHGQGLLRAGRYTGTRYGGIKGRGSKYVFI
jgi:hypothetical protein